MFPSDLTPSAGPVGASRPTPSAVAGPRADTPSVLIQGDEHTRAVSIDARLLQDRIVFLGTAIDNEVANRVVKELVLLDRLDAEAPITLYLNSPGGSVVDGMAIYDTLRHIRPPVHCVVSGMAASMGAIILSGCERGHRRILPHGEVLLHQPLGGTQGQATDIEISTRRLLRMKEMLLSILADNTGHPYEKLVEDCDRDYWMGAEEALAYGIVDEILR
jgi:ATP-dependent Clp protease protease subunit